MGKTCTEMASKSSGNMDNYRGVDFGWELINKKNFDVGIMNSARSEGHSSTPAPSNNNESTILADENIGDHILPDEVMSRCEIEVDNDLEGDERTLYSESLENIQDEKRTPWVKRDGSTINSVQREYSISLKSLQTMHNSIDCMLIRNTNGGSNDDFSGTQLRILGAEAKTKAALSLALLQSMRSRGERRAIELVEKGADPNSKDSYGFALTQAIRAGYVELARKLLACGANPRAKDSYGDAILQTTRAGFEAFAIELVEKGADPNSKDSYGFAITQAINGGLETLEKVLLARGALAPPKTQILSGSNRITIAGGFTIRGDIPYGTCLQISSDDGIIQIVGFDHGSAVHSISANILRD